MADAAPQQQSAPADAPEQKPPTREDAAASPSDGGDVAAAGGGASAEGAGSDAAGAADAAESGPAGDTESAAAGDGEAAGGEGGSSLLLEGEEEARRQEEARAAQLATRPFGEQMAEVMANLKLKSHAAEAVRYLGRLLESRPADVASQPGLFDLLSKIISDGPALPAAGSAMAALARLCLEPGPRARVRTEAACITPVVRYLSLAELSKSANAEAAALLVANLASDRLARRALVAAGAVEALLTLLQKLEGAHASALACYVAAGLMVLATAEEGGRGAARFVEAGGIEVACQALADRPRADGGRGTLRLRLLLAELCRVDKGWEARAHAAAGDLAAAGGGRASLAAS